MTDTTEAVHTAEEITTIEVTSFGYRHGIPPQDMPLIDVRERLSDPAAGKAVLDDGRPLREHTGLHPQVRQRVLSHRDADDVVHEVITAALASRAAGVGCSGGRHRSAVLAETAAEVLRLQRYRVQLTHRDLDKPVLRS